MCLTEILLESLLKISAVLLYFIIKLLIAFIEVGLKICQGICIIWRLHHIYIIYVHED